jgi:hypothetical protein
MTAKIELQSNGKGDDEALNHAMAELGDASQCLLIIGQLNEILGSWAPDLSDTVEALKETKEHYTDKLAELLAHTDGSSDKSLYVLEALEFSDTYRQQKWVYGKLAAQKIVFTEGGEMKK